MAIRYRYAVRWMDFKDSNDYYKLRDYARQHFKSVIESDNTLYFNASPVDVKSGLDKLGISTTYVDILTTANLEPREL